MKSEYSRAICSKLQELAFLKALSTLKASPALLQELKNSTAAQRKKKTSYGKTRFLPKQSAGKRKARTARWRLPLDAQRPGHYPELGPRPFLLLPQDPTCKAQHQWVPNTPAQPRLRRPTLLWYPSPLPHSIQVGHSSQQPMDQSRLILLLHPKQTLGTCPYATCPG